jgi:hypothetical protein
MSPSRDLEFNEIHEIFEAPQAREQYAVAI